MLSLLINLMIINTKPLQEQQQTIDYIRHLANFVNPNLQKLEDSDSLVLSNSEPDSLHIQLRIPNQKDKKSSSKDSRSYVSPYKQESLSMKKIMHRQRRRQIELKPFQLHATNARETQKKSNSKSSKKVVSPAKYLHIPQRYLNERKNLTEQVKTEAKQIYSKELKAEGKYTDRQKKEKWADFLLRQRRWESQKNDKIQIAGQRMLQKERQTHKQDFTPRQYPRMNIEDHIRLINRKKIKLKEELISHNLNYYTWQTPYSPDRQRPRSPEKKTPEIKAFSRQQSPMMAKSNYNPRDRTIQVSNDRELQFLIDKNR